MKRILAALALLVSFGTLLPAQVDGDGPTPETAERIGQLIADLGSDDWQTREEATKELAKMGPVTTPFLLAAKKATDDYEVLRRISRVLEETGGWAQDPDEVERRIGQKLAIFKGEPILHMSPGDIADQWVDEPFRSAIEELRGLGAGVGGALSSEALSSDSPIYRANLCYLMGTLGTADQAPALAKLLEDSDATVRGMAAYALGELGGGGQIEALHRCASSDADTNVRVYAILALGRTKNKDAVDQLIGFLGHDEVSLRQAAIYALNRVTGQNHNFNPYYPPGKRKQAVERWKSWWQENRGTFEFPASLPEGSRQSRLYRMERAVRIEAGGVGPGVPVPPPVPVPREAVPQAGEAPQEDAPQPGGDEAAPEDEEKPAPAAGDEDK
ncbi:MAG: HEAT repeat domain-containing protein [Planctomycetes bacterium]|nr:HEAT repeat domain-containing protein [Planctomycetota bacterium]